MRVAALQLDIVWEARDENYARVSRFAENAAGEGADLLVLPEMFATGFSMDTSVTGEASDGATAAFMSDLARKNGIGVIGGYVESAADGRGHNLAVAYDRGGAELARYSKTHLFAFLDEEKHHLAGEGPAPFVFEGVRLACFVCYDLRFPELFRLTADACDAVCVIASWPNARQSHWDTLLPARAVENQQYVIGVNRVGEGGGHRFDGGSAIYDPFGEKLAHGGDAEELLLAEVDPQRVREVREAMPFLKDRRF